MVTHLLIDSHDEQYLQCPYRSDSVHPPVFPSLPDLDNGVVLYVVTIVENLLPNCNENETNHVAVTVLKISLKTRRIATWSVFDWNFKISTKRYAPEKKTRTYV